MRKALLFAAVCSLLSTVALAQQKQSLSIFVSDLSYTKRSTDNGQWGGGVGVAFERMFSERLALQGAIAYERHRTYPYLVEDDGSITQVEARRLNIVPIDLTARYHFVNDTRWKPYIGLGAHYVAAPNVDRRFRYQNHLDGAVDGGTTFLLTPSFGLLLNARMLVGDREPYDEQFKISAGLSWRF